MKNSILNLGKALNKTEQQTINGGGASGSCRNIGDSCINGWRQNGICVIGPYGNYPHQQLVCKA